MQHRRQLAVSLSISLFASAVGARDAAAEVVIAQPSSLGASANAGFAIRPNARLIMAPRPTRPVTTSAAPRPRPRPNADPQPPPPQPTTGPRILTTLTRVEGPIARPSAQQSMQQVQIRAATCFQRAVGMNPSVQGLMVIRFGIGPAGNVTSVEEAANYVRDSTLSECLASSMSTVRFTPYTGHGPALAMVQIRFLQR